MALRLLVQILFLATCALCLPQQNVPASSAADQLIARQTQEPHLPKAPREILPPLIKDFPAINWESTWNSCPDGDLQIIAESIRVLDSDVFPLAGNRNHDRRGSAFNRFFISPDEELVPLNWITSLSGIPWLHLMNNIDLLQSFLRAGKRDKNGNVTPSRQVSIHCFEPPEKVPRCNGKIGAYTRRPPFVDVWTIVLCPEFFKKEYIQRLGDRTPKLPSDLEALVSFEHILAHEFTHTLKRFGAEEFIPDYEELDDAGFLQRVYGATACHKFAWKYAREPAIARININTTMNADNYAWYFTNLFFANKWNWQDNGRELESTLASVLEAPKNEEGEPSSNAVDPATWKAPFGCRMSVVNDTFATYYCPYKGEPVEDYIANINEPYYARGENCILTPECHTPMENSNAINPKCVCKCNDQITSLSDDQCTGWEGSLPDRSSPPNGAPPG